MLLIFSLGLVRTLLYSQNPPCILALQLTCIGEQQVKVMIVSLPTKATITEIIKDILVIFNR